MQTIIDYFSNNTGLVITIAAVLVASIACIIIIVAARKSREKKKQKLESQKQIDNYLSNSQAVPYEDSIPVDTDTKTKETTDRNLEKEKNTKKTPVKVAEEAEPKIAKAPKADKKEDVKNEEANKVATAKNEVAPIEEKTASEPVKPAEKQAEPILTENKPSIPKNKEVTAFPKQASKSHKIPSRYSGKWLITTDEEGKFSAQLLASNGEVLLRSESYSALSGVKSGIETLKNNIAKNNFAVSVDKNDNYFFKLYSSSTRLLCISEGYSSKETLEKTIESVKRFAKTAIITRQNDQKTE